MTFKLFKYDSFKVELSLWVCPSERFLAPAPPPPFNFVQDLNLKYFQQKKCILYYFSVKVRLGQFLDRTLRLGQARGPSAATMTDFQFQQFPTKLVYN